MKLDLFDFYKTIEKEKGNLRNKHISFSDKLFICTYSFALLFFVCVMFLQIELVIDNFLALWVPIVTFVFFVFCLYFFRKTYCCIMDEIAFGVCEDYAKKFNGGENES